MLRIEILHDVVGTSGYHCGVLRSFPVERIEQGIGYQEKIDNPNITMEEYIRLEEEKARRRGRNFNWETAMYGKVSYFDDFDYFKDFENDFTAIVYNYALTSRP
ncbi:hypothetical protein Tco_0929721 [Tanacetum coccineum]